MSTELVKQDDNHVVSQEDRGRTVLPVCDVYENAQEYLIMAEVPGVEEQDIDLNLDRSRLSMEAKRSSTGAGWERMSYARVFEIPNTVDTANVDAKLGNGVLSIHLPKTRQARVRQISVTSG